MTSSLFVFGLAVVLLVYVPGRALLGLLKLAPPPLEHATLCLALGIPVSSMAYWACGYFELRWALWLFVGLALIVCAFGLRNIPRQLPRVRPTQLLLAGVLVCTCLPFAFSPFHFKSLARTTGGGLTHLAEPDPTFHVALARELQRQIPPQVPFLPGRPLNYHYGGDLLAAMLADSGVDAADVTLRYLPLLFMAFAVLACFCCTRLFLPSESAAALCVLLVILGEDFSFVPGLLLGSREVWSAHYLQVPSSFSLYSLNPMLPALGFLACALLCLERYFATRRRAWLAAAALTAATLVEYKVFTAAHLLGALGVTAAVYVLRLRRSEPAWACGALGMAIAPLVLLASATNAGLIQVTWGPWPYVSQAFERMGLAPWPSLLALPLYLVLAVGARALGLGALARELVRPQPDGAVRFLAGVIAASGPLLTLLFVITSGGYAPGRAGVPDYNNSVWFFVHSKYVLWPFAVGAVWNWACAPGVRKLAAALLMIALSVPSTLQMLRSFQAARLVVADAPTVAMLEFVKREVPSGAVCIGREGITPLLLLTTGCRTLEFDLFSGSFVPLEERLALQRGYQGFWEAWARAPQQPVPERGWHELSALGAEYLIAGRRSARTGGELTGGGLRLRRLFETPRFVVFKVERVAGPA